MRISFNNVKIRASRLKRELTQKISSVLEKGVFVHGRENERLAKALQRFFGGYVVATASGHDSLSLALRALRIKRGDEVLFPVNAYPTVFPIALSDAMPVPVDVDENGLIDPKELSKKISKKTKAVVVVHLYGLVVNVDAIKKRVKERGIFLIEDCAQAFGSIYKGKPVGTLGDISCFSFYPTKNLSTLGDGGALWTSDKNLYEYLKKAVSYGSKTPYKSEFVSGHSRLPEIQAAVLNLYFKYLKKEQSQRKKVFNQYKSLFKKYKITNHTRILFDNKNSDPALHLFVIEARKRDRLQSYLKGQGVETHIHYPHPVHLVPAFSYLRCKKGDFPKAERLAKNIISIPFHPHLTRKEIELVVKSIRDFYHG
ncbi:DegT/DnrJ/EryC1/StrS family aminotransferase [Candidatus Roizmanbacteria bacterium]|nr:DegT/DnrJ/EryC1/StrS family aminotransferase [Candidatus Roizmanbacteria bacterium]